MWSQFLLENSHFAINLLASLSFFSIFWLYFDAWIDRKTLKEALKIIGFLLLSLSFLSHAILIEHPSLVLSTANNLLSEKITFILRNIGYLFLIIGLTIDPLIPKPKVTALIFTNFVFPNVITPILATIVAWLYLRRATVGLENHTKKVSLAFFILAIYELLSTTHLFLNTPNFDLFQLISAFGPIWLIAHLLLFLTATILIHWAFSYLLKRINTQLFIIFTTTIISIFLVTTVSFTFLLLKNLATETLAGLNTNVSVLSYALDSKKTEGLASATILAQNPQIITSLLGKDRKNLTSLTENFLLSRKLNSVIIVDDAGQVLVRGEEKDRYGDSLSGNTLVKRALLNQSVSTLSTLDGPLAPQVLVQSSAPIISEGKNLGATIVSLSLDNNFLDGIKKLTGLEISIYGDNLLSATTISDLKGVTRPIGIKNTDKNINNKVLIKGESFLGQTSLLNISYFSVYQPLKDVDNGVIGMLMAGHPTNSIYSTAEKSITLTFLASVLLIIISIFPSYFIAKYITNQLQ